MKLLSPSFENDPRLHWLLVVEMKNFVEHMMCFSLDEVLGVKKA